jgi:hypothetical protein
MVGLVYSLTPKAKDGSAVPWYVRPDVLAIVVGVGCVILNIIFF